MATSVVAASTTLWATPSKEWVIQPKPKPGRKPKKDPAVPDSTDDADGKGRRVQNRAAQRAFRERKQSQLAELQARLQSYEQGEIERNVALQNIAKRLKEENEALRHENSLLKEKVSVLEKEQLLHESEKKRWRDHSPSSSASRKRPRTEGESNASLVSTVPGIFSSASPPSMASSPDSYSSDSPFSPAPLESQLPGSPSNTVFGFVATDKPDAYVGHSSFVSCGFCSEHTICVCREAFPPSSEVIVPKTEVFESTASSGVIRIGTPAHSPPSILENLPAFQPAVPLRRRQTASTDPIPPVAQPSQPPATCTGDPSNCLACADDSFGKAFCAALGRSVVVQASNCSCPTTTTNFSVDPAVTSLSNGAGSHTPPTSSALFSQHSDDETIPTNDAWKQLKSHPNVAFSDLALLADVVARRSRCTGPTVVISPAPGTVTPERIVSPAPSTVGFSGTSDIESVLLTDPHAHYHEERARSSPPRLVPQEILLQCGRERLRQVQAAGVREALRLLDAKFPSS